MPKRIMSVHLKRELDDNPDLSWIGDYSSTPKCDWAIDRQERGDMGWNEYRYFNPAMSGEGTGNPNSPEQDYQRMEDYNRQGWYMVGVTAKAEVMLTGGVIQTIRSGGLWGTESDSGEGYFEEIEGEQLADLQEQLMAIGFTKKQIAKAFTVLERVEA